MFWVKSLERKLHSSCVWHGPLHFKHRNASKSGTTWPYLVYVMYLEVRGTLDDDHVLLAQLIRTEADSQRRAPPDQGHADVGPPQTPCSTESRLHVRHGSPDSLVLTGPSEHQRLTHPSLCRTGSSSSSSLDSLRKPESEIHQTKWGWNLLCPLQMRDHIIV